MWIQQDPTEWKWQWAIPAPPKDFKWTCHLDTVDHMVQFMAQSNFGILSMLVVFSSQTNHIPQGNIYIFFKCQYVLCNPSLLAEETHINFAIHREVQRTSPLCDRYLLCLPCLTANFISVGWRPDWLVVIIRSWSQAVSIIRLCVQGSNVSRDTILKSSGHLSSVRASDF